MYVDMSVFLQQVNDAEIFKETEINGINYILDIPKLGTIYNTKELKCCTNALTPFLVRMNQYCTPISYVDLCSNYVFEDATEITYEKLVQKCNWMSIGNAYYSTYTVEIPTTEFGYVYVAKNIAIKLKPQKIKIMRIPEDVQIVQAVKSLKYNNLKCYSKETVDIQDGVPKYIVCPMVADSVSGISTPDVQQAFIIDETEYTLHIKPCIFA